MSRRIFLLTVALACPIAVVAQNLSPLLEIESFKMDLERRTRRIRHFNDFVNRSELRAISKFGKPTGEQVLMSFGPTLTKVRYANLSNGYTADYPTLVTMTLGHVDSIEFNNGGKIHAGENSTGYLYASTVFNGAWTVIVGYGNGRIATFMFTVRDIYH